MENEFPDWYADREDVEPKRCRILLRHVISRHDVPLHVTQDVVTTPLSRGIHMPAVAGTWDEVNQQIAEWLRTRHAHAEQKAEECKKEMEWCYNALQIVLNRKAPASID